MIGEPDVTLTDYGLAVECAAFAYLLARRGEPGQPLRRRLVLFFASVAAAALLGGTVHGFFLDPGTAGARLAWGATMLAAGVTTLAAWAAGARIRFSAAGARWIEGAALVAFAGYAGLVLIGIDTYGLVVANYLPAAAFLLVVLLLAYRCTRARPLLAAALGLGATFLAAAARSAGLGLHPRYFNHNALYHVIQAGALFLLFLGARWLVATRGVQETRC
jgi:hypothetical protein